MITQGSNGEVLKVENFIQGELFNNSIYTYDAKSNPLKNVLGYNKLPLSTDKIFNLVTSKSLNANQEIKTNSIFDYTYNSSNFPTERNQSFYNNEGQLTAVTSAYFY